MLTVEDADRLLGSVIEPFATETVALDHAHGRVLREEVFADRDAPPFHRVAMDGIAVSYRAFAEGQRQFVVRGMQPAGSAQRSLTEANGCLEVMTGAVLPDGCDAVIRYEDLHIVAGMACIAPDLALQPMANVHLRAADCHTGQRLLAQGMRLLPPHIAVLATVGKAEVRVTRRPTLAFVSTGDELVGVEQQPATHQIRQSNGPTIRAALQMAGYPDVRLLHCADSREALVATLRQALTSDVVLFSGGVSTGKFDLVPTVLQAYGIREIFHKIEQKPGKPLWFGMSEQNQPIFGLPGNPVSSLLCAYRYVMPQLSRAEGAPPLTPARVRLAGYTPLPNPFTHFVVVAREDNVVRPVSSNGSGDFLSLVGSDGFVEVAPGAAHESLPFHPWRFG